MELLFEKTIREKMLELFSCSDCVFYTKEKSVRYCKKHNSTKSRSGYKTIKAKQQACYAFDNLYFKKLVLFTKNYKEIESNKKQTTNEFYIF